MYRRGHPLVEHLESPNALREASENQQPPKAWCSRIHGLRRVRESADRFVSQFSLHTVD